MQSVLEKAQETLGRQNLGTMGLEAAKAQINDLVLKVSNQCLTSPFSINPDELIGLYTQQIQTTQPGNSLLEICSSENTLRFEAIKYNQNLHNSCKEDGTSGLSIGIGLQDEKKENNLRNYPKLNMRKHDNGDDEDEMFFKRPVKRNQSFNLENERTSIGCRTSLFEPVLDLNSHEENDGARSRTQFDLNGFSWT